MRKMGARSLADLVRMADALWRRLAPLLEMGACSQLEAPLSRIVTAAIARPLKTAELPRGSPCRYVDTSRCSHGPNVGFKFVREDKSAPWQLPVVASFIASAPTSIPRYR